jgi:predicted ArsR family transcriptional regulator
VKTAGDAILFQLKSLGEAQAETLARRLGISVQAVRQRLERLPRREPRRIFRSRARSGAAHGGSGHCRRAQHRSFPTLMRNLPSI